MASNGLGLKAEAEVIAPDGDEVGEELPDDQELAAFLGAALEDAPTLAYKVH